VLNKNLLTVIIPNTFSWLLASLLLLIYSFDILEFVENSPSNPFAGMGIILLGFILILVVVIMYLTGVYLDKNPKYLRYGIILGMVGSSVSTILLVFFITESFLLITSLTSLAFFFGVLLTSSGTLFAGVTDMWYRGRTYSLAIGIFIIIGILCVLFGGLFSHSFAEPEILSYSFVSILTLVGVLGLLLSIVFFFLTLKMRVPWQNDEWPTKFGRIVGRRSVRAYIVTHFLLYCMLGIIITSFSQLGEPFLGINWTFNDPNFGTFVLPIDKSFWFFVLLTDLIVIIPAGYLSDKLGRKNLIVASIYGLVFTALIFGLEKNWTSFVIAASVVGFSFALLHPTLDSSLWADLSPRDGLGRYYAIGFISLALGLGIGSGVGHWLFNPSYVDLVRIEYVTYLIIILAIFAALPLFWVSDSFKPLDFSLLLVIDEGGLPIFDYSFTRTLDMKVDLNLLSGALRAVSSFMSETIKDKGVLSMVRHGNHFILTEIKGGISAAIFCNKQDPELKAILREFLRLFYNKYADTLENWDGSRDVFDGAVAIAEEVFGHLAPSTNLES
jgi:MFS family permease